MPGQTGMARMMVSKSRKPNRPLNASNSFDSVGSTISRFSAMALSWRFWVKLSFSVGGRSVMDVMPRARYAEAFTGPTPARWPMWSRPSGQQRAMKGHSYGSKQWAPYHYIGDGAGEHLA